MEETNTTSISSGLVVNLELSSVKKSIVVNSKMRATERRKKVFSFKEYTSVK